MIDLTPEQREQCEAAGTDLASKRECMMCGLDAPPKVWWDKGVGVMIVCPKCGSEDVFTEKQLEDGHEEAEYEAQRRPTRSFYSDLDI
ncbi:MAG TPA: hypothetical protein VF183_04715 [Acidimicrobiales bacterium]